MSTPPNPRNLSFKLLAFIVAWNIAYLALSAFPANIFCIFACAACWLLAAICLLAAFVIAGVRRSKHAIGFAAVLLTLGAAEWFFGGELALRTRFTVIRSSLQTDVTRLRTGQPIAFRDQPHMARSEGDVSSPRSPVVFVDGGLLDHWGGFVFDPASAGSTPGPTAALATAGRRHPVPLPFQSWFGAKMTYALPLGGGWFYCWFT